MQEQNKYRIAFYARMARDNDDVMRNESVSIESKIVMFAEYAANNEWIKEISNVRYRM